MIWIPFAAPDTEIDELELKLTKILSVVVLSNDALMLMPLELPTIEVANI